MGDAAARFELEPVHAAMADADAIDVERLWNDDVINAIGTDAATFGQIRDTGKPAAFLVDGAAHLDRSGELDAGTANGVRGENRSRDACFHSAGAATVNAAVTHHATERIDGPSRARRHDVEVTVEMNGGAIR